MNRFSSRHALAFGTLAVCALSVGLGISTEACSSSSTPAATNGDSGTGNAKGLCANPTLTVAFNPGYSAYIPASMHAFQIPLGVKELPTTAAVTWTASDTGKVAFSNGTVDFGKDTPIANTMVTTQGAGDVTIVATSGGQCGSTTLHITAATDDDWTIGSERYNNGTLLMRTTNRGLTTAVAQDGGTQVQCTSCHGPTATASTFTTVEHTPEQTGGFSDEELTGIFEMATIPVGGYFDPSVICGMARNCTATRAQQTYATFHAWNVTPDQAKGLVVYLRSLTPAPQTGVANFMPRVRPDAGMAGMPDTGAIVPAPDADTGEAATIDAPTDTGASDAAAADAAAADAGGGG